MLPIIVSAYIDLHRDKEGLKSIHDYLNHSIPLLNLDHPKIIFLEPHVIELIKNKHPSTTIIPFSKKDLFFKFDNLKLPLNANKDKDTLGYLSVQLNKTDWIVRAANMNPENDQFIWVDFGISHICSKIDFSHLRNEYENIRIPGCWNPSESMNVFIESPNWFFCGGVFGGHIAGLRVFDCLVKKYAIELMRLGMATWEVNIWKMVYDKNPNLFDWYYSDHDCGMITNY